MMGLAFPSRSNRNKECQAFLCEDAAAAGQVVVEVVLVDLLMS